jgi:hypothetical protein
MLLMLAVATPGPAEAKKVSPAKACKKFKGRTIVKNKFARVFKRDSGSYVTLYGCLYAKRGRIKVDQLQNDEFVTFGSFKYVRLSGRVVAYDANSEDVSCKAECPEGYDPTSEHTTAFNLRTKKETVNLNDLGVRQLGVTSTGVIAWTSGVDDNVSVFKSVGHDDKALLDMGNIAATSLDVSGLNATWLKDGAPQSAKIG